MPRPADKWKPEHLATFYRLAKAGETDAKICEVLGICKKTFQRWCRNRPEIKVMLAEGRKKEDEKFLHYVYERLPAHLQDRWEHLLATEKLTLDLHRLDGLAEREQQMLYVHAFIHHKFVASRARRTCGLMLERVKGWMREDPGFVQLLAEVQEAKKDFCEWALMELVGRGETAAVIFANRTLNRDRGYNDKIQVDVKAEERHALEELGALSVEQKRMLLEAIERGRALPAPREVIEVEAR